MNRYSLFAIEEKHGKKTAKACIASIDQKVGVFEAQTTRVAVLGPAMGRGCSSANRSKA